TPLRHPVGGTPSPVRVNAARPESPARGRNPPRVKERGRVRMSLLRWTAVGVALVLAASCFVVLDPVSNAIVAAAGCVVLVAVTVADRERRIIPNRLVLPALVAVLVARSALDPSLRWILGALVTGGILLVLALIYPAGLGMGDVKLAAFLGAWLGWEGLV